MDVVRKERVRGERGGERGGEKEGERGVEREGVETDREIRLEQSSGWNHLQLSGLQSVKY